MAINPGAAIRRSSKAQTTGGEVRLYDVTHPDAPVEVREFGPWFVVCEHDLGVTAATRRLGRRAMVSPETWCERCEALAVARGYEVGEAVSS